MYHRFCAIFIVVCFVVAAAGCASEAEKNREEVLLPKQTGTNFDRRITVDNESSFKEMKRREAQEKSKKRVKKERTEVAPTESEQPEETPTPPEKFR
jgi:hypothetical protein